MSPTSLSAAPVVQERSVLNFSAGPAVLPESVLRQAQEDIWDLAGTGIGVMEHSHRGKAFDAVLQRTEADCRRLADIGDDHAVLFLQGGASLQFAMIPMNFLAEDAVADYPDTGTWTSKAIEEARAFGRVNVAFDGKAVGYAHVPDAAELRLSPAAAYLHYCSNNTIYGTRYETPPATSAMLVADTSSEMFSRPIDVARHGIIYAGAQKNLGPSGVTLVIIRRDLLDRAVRKVPAMLSYKKHADNDSCYNTPPTFAIHVMGLVFRWILDLGGLEAMAARNDAKAKLVYDAIDGSGGFYSGVARSDCRSTMNVTFRTPSPELDEAFVKEAQAAGMSGLKGHRSVGGLRASIYNAFPHAGCAALAQFMRDFAAKRG